MPTRRAVTIALATAPLAGTASAAQVESDDPIFAAIEAHRAAFALALAGTDYNEDKFNALVATAVDRLEELLAMTPTTSAGCAAMLRHVEAHANRDDHESQMFSDWYAPIKEPATTLLGRIAAVLEQAGA